MQEGTKHTYKRPGILNSFARQKRGGGGSPIATNGFGASVSKCLGFSYEIEALEKIKKGGKSSPQNVSCMQKKITADRRGRRLLPSLHLFRLLIPRAPPYFFEAPHRDNSLSGRGIAV